MTASLIKRGRRPWILLGAALVAGAVANRWLAPTKPEPEGVRRSGGSPGIRLTPLLKLHRSAAASTNVIAAALPVKFEMLGGWKYVPGKNPIPADVKKLDGQWVEITALMMPLSQTQNLTEFVAVQGLWDCCYGQTPEVNHVIMVTLAPGITVDYYPDPMRLIGRLSVTETRADGEVISIYRLEAYDLLAK